ncbi:MAG: hypothetical protein IJ151_02005 [Bacteroidales bacterium]|nr:hypothetical protein [Bacteroidales bacterium]
MKRTIFIYIIVAAVILAVSSLPAKAIGSQSVTLKVGETKTLYLPSSVTALRLKSCNFYTTSPAYVDIKSFTEFSVTIIAKKPTSSTPVIIRCDYTYYVTNGGYVYGASGGYDFKVTCELPTITITDNTELKEIPEMAKVVFSRTFKSGWNSLCVPFELSKKELVAASNKEECRIAILKKVCKDYSPARLQFEDVDVLEAGMPSLVYFPEDVTIKITKNSVQLVSSPKEDSLMKGCFVSKKVGIGYYKLAPDGKSFGVTTKIDALVKAMRVYIKI